MAHQEVVFSLSHAGSHDHSDASDDAMHFAMDEADKQHNDRKHSTLDAAPSKLHKDSVSRLKHPSFTTPKSSLQLAHSPLPRRRISPNPSVVPSRADPRYIERRATLEAINAFAASLDRKDSGSEDFLHFTANGRPPSQAPTGSIYDIHSASPGDTIHASSGQHHSDIRLHQLVRNMSHAESIASNATMNLARRLMYAHGAHTSHGSAVTHSGDSALGSHPTNSMEDYYQSEAPLLPAYPHESGDTGKKPGDEAESPKASLADTILLPYKKGMHHCSAYIPNIVSINVCGKRFQTTYETLAKYPSTLLGKPELRDRYWNPVAEEYFFNRHRGSFEAILYMYLSNGVLIRPRKVPLEVFHEELRFFKIPEEIMTQFWRREGFRIKRPPQMPSNEFLKTLWQIMEYPNSSTFARAFAIFSILIILVACVSFVIETVPGVQHALGDGSTITENHTIDPLTSSQHRQHDKATNPFHIIEILCISWFTIELLLKFIACPSKAKFMHSLANWIDIVAIAPFYITLIFPQTRYSEVSMGFALLRVIRLLHIFQILKISRYSRGLTTLSLTFAAGFRELLLLGFVLLLVNIIFASGVYIAEYENPNSRLKSLPEALWYGIITMTTVGYGDYIPQTAWGRFIGSICAVCGLLVISLPIPVIVKNFKHFYRQEVQLRHVNDLIVKDSDKVKLTVCHDNWLKKD